MSATGLDVFDTTLQKTNGWLHDLMQALGWTDRHKAYIALRATLHALRDRLTVEEVAHLGAQFPMLIRGFFYEGWDPTGKPLRQRSIEQFLAHIEQQFKDDESVDTLVTSAQVAEAVFRVMSQRISAGEIENIRHVLPAEIRSLWP